MAKIGGNGLAYVGDDGTVSTYHMWMDDRVVLHVMVDNTDPKLRIGFARPDWIERGEVVRYRAGVATKALHSYRVGADEADVEVKEHIDGASVQSYVYTRLPWLLADVYVPKSE